MLINRDDEQQIANLKDSLYLDLLYKYAELKNKYQYLKQDNAKLRLQVTACEKQTANIDITESDLILTHNRAIDSCVSKAYKHMKESLGYPSLIVEFKSLIIKNETNDQ